MSTIYTMGSDKKIARLDPHPSAVLGGENAVFATPDYIDAVIFSASWTDYNFGFGQFNNKKKLCEMYPGAFGKLNRIGYIHYLRPDNFHLDPRTGLDNEYVSNCPTDVVRCKKVNVLEEIKKSNVEMITFASL